MQWTELHGPLLARAFETVLGRSEFGSMAYARCLTPDAVARLSTDVTFNPPGWRVLRVADVNASEERTITADRAVEIRETKGDATLLLVDTERVGAGMDGIYNASREADEASLFREAHRLGGEEIARCLSPASRRYAERAIRKAQGYGRTYAVSRWAQFDFLCRIAATGTPPGAHLHLLGLWPILDSAESNEADDLNTSLLFVNGLLGTAGASLAPAARIEALRLDRESEQPKGDLERFLRSVDTKPLLGALEALAEKQHLWIGALRIRSAAQSIQGIELISWRNRGGKIAKWSGLVEDPDENTSGEAKPPVLILARDDEQHGGTLEVRWKPDPADLAEGAIGYRVSVRTDMDEEIAVLDNTPHTARKGGEKRRFGNDDFSSLSEDSVLQAKVVVEVAGNDSIEPQESEEFTIRFGQRPEQVGGSVGETVRTFSEGLAALESRETVSVIVASSPATVDARSFVVLRTPVERGRRKSFRVLRPSLLAEVEGQWIDRQGKIGRWTVAVRGSGSRAGALEFIPIDERDDPTWARTVAASRKMAALLARMGGGVGQVYDDHDAASFSVVQEYLRAWVTLLEAGAPSLAIAHTVEVRSLVGRTIGLIVLPAHPLRVAWHAAYDNLILHTAFEQEQGATEIRKEFQALDGAMFPAFLPNPRGGAFVFADTLGFHTVGMVPDADKEPKAAVAVLAHALLGDGSSADSAPLVGSKSASVLANEIIKYLECHKSETDGKTGYASPLLHVHALRAGDGMTVARSLGGVHAHYRQAMEEEGDEQDVDEAATAAPAFSLDLYPSSEQRGVAGRFIADAREKRRRGAGVLASDDRWMLESLSFPGGVNMPRLRWARKEPDDGESAARPDSAAHLAIAFDTFESQVVAKKAEASSRPYHAFGLLSFYERHYSSYPTPVWQSTAAPATVGEKHPSRRILSETLARLQGAIERLVARHVGATAARPVLRTEVSPDKSDGLKDLHRLCDWVVTLDRNAGIEYFDSPRDNRDIYDAYVIDCVPEREDLGCLQLITSTANLEEVRLLLDDALDQMALSRSRRNAEFLLEHLKALSGRLAIRLTGHRPATSELIALAVSHGNCRRASANDECWVSLEDGFIVPVDDVWDLLPPLEATAEEEETGSRPDLIYVSTAPRRGLVFRFIEVKYRRDLRAAQKPDLLRHIEQQTQALRERWNRWYGHDGVCTSFRAIRRAKLARVLRFYADKAHRHYLPAERHAAVVSEIDRMVELGGGYAFSTVGTGDRGWVFCPEYVGLPPRKISSDDWSTEIFLFGPGLLPDSDPGSATIPSVAALSDTKRPSRPSSGRTANRAEANSAFRDNVEKAIDDVSEESPENPADANQPVEVPSPLVELGVDVLTNADVRWTLTTKGNPHLLIAGLPGMGKTTCLLNLCRQMVAAGVHPIVFSYHQDIDERLADLVAPVRFVDFDGLGFNPLTVTNRASPRGHLDVAGSLRDIFAAIFPELGDLQCESIRRAIKESFTQAGWSASEVGAREPEFRRFVEILRGEPKPDRGLRTLLARLTELDDYGFFNVGQTRESLWTSDRPTVVRIHTTQNDSLQRAFASLVFYGLYKDMFRRGVQERITHALIFDEAHRAAGLRLIPTMAKECRKYGISLVLASQEARDFNASLFSAIANYLVLRLTEADAKALVRNVATAKQERTLIDRIKQMPRFRALYFCEEKHRPSSVKLSSLD